MWQCGSLLVDAYGVYLIYATVCTLQIGDEKEIMYFRAKSDKDRKEWMEAFRIGTHT